MLSSLDISFHSIQLKVLNFTTSILQMTKLRLTELICQGQKTLPKLTFKSFCLIIFQLSLFLIFVLLDVY